MPLASIERPATCGEILDQRQIVMVNAGFALPLRPIAEGLRVFAVRLVLLRIDRPADRESGFERIPALQDAAVGGLAEQERGAVGLLDQTQPLLLIELRAGHEVEQLVARQVFARPGVIRVGRFDAQHAEVDAQFRRQIQMSVDGGLRHVGLPCCGRGDRCLVRSQGLFAAGCRLPHAWSSGIRRMSMRATAQLSHTQRLTHSMS